MDGASIVVTGGTSYRLYKGAGKVVEGPSPLVITGLAAGSDVAKGTYKVVNVENGTESDKVDVPAFKVNEASGG